MSSLSMVTLPSLPTGLDVLDRATGGGAAGDLWVVSGPADVGKTLLVVGLARASALRAHVPVRWLSSREDPESLRASVRSAQGRVAVERLRADDLRSDEQARLTSAESEINQAQMTFTRVPAERLLSAARGSAPGQGSMLVLDCVSDWDADAVADLKRLAVTTGTWLVAVVPDAGKGRRAARTTVGAGADVHPWLERADQFDPGSDRAGEADVSITRPDRSRATTVTVAFQPLYARFVDMRTG